MIQTIGITALVSGSLAFGGGMWLKSTMYKADLADAQEKVRAEELVKINKLSADLGQLELDLANKEAERIQLAAELSAEQQNIKIKYRNITQEVPIYVPENTDQCNYDLDPGLVRLLNNAARGTSPNPASAPSESNPTGSVTTTVRGPIHLAGKPDSKPNGRLASRY